MSLPRNNGTSEMPNSDAFALKNSSLNPFLFADVGVEQNGSTLTVLSVLARLGLDPWVQAGAWARLPRTAMVDCLTNCITQMPLSPGALAGARATAERLVQLLSGTVAQKAGQPVTQVKMPEWLPTAIFCAVVIIAVAAGSFAKPAPAIAPAPVSDTTLMPVRSDPAP